MICPANNIPNSNSPGGSPAPPERVALMRMSFDSLRQFLHLPADVSIDCLVIDPQFDGIVVRVSGEALPEFCRRVPGGQSVIPYVEPVYAMSAVVVTNCLGFAGYSK